MSMSTILEHITVEQGGGQDFLLRYPNFHPAVSNLKQTLMERKSLIKNEPLLKLYFFLNL